MKLIVFIVTMLVLCTLMYLAIAFVSAEWHVFNWHWISRAIFALLAAVLSFYVLNNIENGTIK